LPRLGPVGIVELTQAPNEPLAEMICGLLRSNGISAFSKRDNPIGSMGIGGAMQIWVDEADVERARELLP
jgi:hypothetical protein